MLPSSIYEMFVLGAAAVLNEYMFRLGLALWELRFKTVHYPKLGRISTVFEHTFHQDIRATIVGIILVGMGMCDIGALFNTTMHLFPAYALLRCLNYQKSLIDAANFIREGQGIDYGTGMADNYFHGYINVSLTKRDNGVPGIRERLLNYESLHNVVVPIKRLFVVVTSSLQLKANFSDAPKLESAQSLELVSLDRAGTQRRVYTTGIYRMKDEESGETWYAAVEGATPLQSFYESMNHPATGTWIMKKMKHEIALQFCKALQKVSKLSSTPTFDVIFYNDTSAIGGEVHISDLVKNRIRELKLQGLD